MALGCPRETEANDLLFRADAAFFGAVIHLLRHLGVEDPVAVACHPEAPSTSRKTYERPPPFEK